MLVNHGVWFNSLPVPDAKAAVSESVSEGGDGSVPSLRRTNSLRLLGDQVRDVGCAGSEKGDQGRTSARHRYQSIVFILLCVYRLS